MTWKYKKVKVPDHPNADLRGYVLEHRLVVEKRIERFLKKSEHVHHIDGDVTNNDPDNLEIISNSEHARKHKTVDTVKLKCPECGTGFELKPHRYMVRAKRSKSGNVCCSARCGAASGHKHRGVTQSG